VPGFSRVPLERPEENRFNDFPLCRLKAAEAAGVLPLVNTRLKPGAYEMAKLRVEYSLSIRFVGMNEVTTP
jgi:hypothetical protein